jgi:hypothetical protein
MTDKSTDSISQDRDLTISLVYHGKALDFSFPTSATISDLSERIEDELSVPGTHQKLLVPKLGLLKPPFKDPTLPLTSLANKSIKLLAPNPDEIAKLQAEIASARRQRRSVLPTAPVNKTRDWQRIKEEAEYTFHTLRPLPNLPHPERSLHFLERLRDDAGIKAAMRIHKFSVPLLTEMDPLAYTESTHEGTTRILGLNRNGGEVIELRLRTDAGDGYRDYKTIRKTLCHELAHNVHGPHDAKFWKLCKEIEKEVDRHDWRSGGHALTSSEYYEPNEEVDDDHIDGGGWTGGEFVLGGNSGTGNSVGSNRSDIATGQMNRREILAQAAEERMRKIKQSKQAGEDSAGQSS